MAKRDDLRPLQVTSDKIAAKYGGGSMDNKRRVTAPEHIIYVESAEEINVGLYDLLEVYVQEPTDKPNKDFKVQARPIEFGEHVVLKYHTVSPHCGQLIEFAPSDVTSTAAGLFIGCPHTGIGISSRPDFEDPFVNPILDGKVGEASIDPDLTDLLELSDTDDTTLSEKMQNP